MVRSSSVSKAIILEKLGEMGYSSFALSNTEIVDKAQISCLLKLKTPIF
jgi:hypothetical protein